MSNVINCKIDFLSVSKLLFSASIIVVISPLGWNLRFKFFTEQKLSSSHVTYIFPVKYSLKKIVLNLSK